MSKEEKRRKKKISIAKNIEKAAANTQNSEDIDVERRYMDLLEDRKSRCRSIGTSKTCQYLVRND